MAIVAEEFSPFGVVVAVDDVVVVGIGGEAFARGAFGFSPHDVVGGIDDAVVVVVARHLEEEAANLAAGVRGRVDVEIGCAVVEGIEERVQGLADRSAAGGDEGRVVGGSVGQIE